MTTDLMTESEKAEMKKGLRAAIEQSIASGSVVKLGVKCPLLASDAVRTMHRTWSARIGSEWIVFGQAGDNFKIYIVDINK